MIRVALGACRALLVSVSIVGCAEGSSGVTRMAEGVRYEGRFINPAAYAAYLLGVEREAHADYPAALNAYLEAHAEDPDSPEIWARIGAVRCFSSKPGPGVAAGKSAFERGLKNDARYYGNYLERARCAERARDLRSALADASTAVALRPTDEPSNLLVARLLSALGHHAEARAWLEALQSFHDGSAAFAHALEAARRPPLASPGTHSASPGTLPTSATPAPALPTRSDAFVELRSGRAELARQRAQLELEADPSNADAWIAALVACDALHDEQCFEGALDKLEAPHAAPSPAALDYLQELLARRAGARISF